MPFTLRSGRQNTQGMIVIHLKGIGKFNLNNKDISKLIELQDRSIFPSNLYKRLR